GAELLAEVAGTDAADVAVGVLGRGAEVVLGGDGGDVLRGDVGPAEVAAHGGEPGGLVEDDVLVAVDAAAGVGEGGLVAPEEAGDPFGHAEGVLVDGALGGGLALGLEPGAGGALGREGVAVADGEVVAD